jgi:thiol-disulfide isomerase/thioredoxin
MIFGIGNIVLINKQILLFIKYSHGGFMLKNLQRVFIHLGFILLSLIFLSTSVFAMTNMEDDSPANISNFVGKGEWIIVQAWHSKCTICMKAMPNLVKAKGTFPNAKLIGISLDKLKEDAQSVIDRFNINFPTLLMSTSEFNTYLKKVAKESLIGTPTYLIFAPDGTLKAMQSGYLSPEDIKNYIVKQEAARQMANQVITSQCVANQRVANQVVANQRVANQAVANQRVANQVVSNQCVTNEAKNEQNDN